jgi:SAM-dependent methyltransferase
VSGPAAPDPPVRDRERYAAYVPLLLGYGPVLQLGSGPGALLGLLAEAGVPATGVEPDPAAAAEARLQGREVVVAGPAEYLEADPAPGPFRAVFCAGLIERLPPAGTLRLLAGARRVLAPGGRLVVATANPASWPVLAHRFWRDPAGARLYDERLLTYLCGRAGFVVERSAGNPADHPAPPPEALGGAEPVVHPGLIDPIAVAAARVGPGLDHRYRDQPGGDPHDPEWAFELVHAVKTLSDRLTQTQEGLRELDRAHRELVGGLYQPAEVYVVARAPLPAAAGPAGTEPGPVGPTAGGA